MNRIINDDCVKFMRAMPASAADLVFADPPFNIGYDYDTYDDSRKSDEYLSWCSEWIEQVRRVLRPNGTFWLAIGDEYAAELKVLATREFGFTCRSWVIWYYTFGVHCHSKFTRSHAHLFHFVRDNSNFKFNTDEIRVPSARQLVYGDKRANPKGRVPDDTWIIEPQDPRWVLRPQELDDGFAGDSDTWFFPRVCGTFKERQGFHGCQMPEQLLARIIRVSSDPGDLVFDPFVGSGTTLAVAKKLGRDYLGTELSAEYARLSSERVESIDRGSGVPEMLPKPPQRKRQRREARKRQSSPKRNGNGVHLRSKAAAKKSVPKADRLLEVYQRVSDGFSIDRVIADPELNARFADECRDEGIDGDLMQWNLHLLRLRKSNRLPKGNARRTQLPRSAIASCEFASEIALSQVRGTHDISLDQMLCDPRLVRRFDQIASEICPGFDRLVYRWAALSLRKRAKLARKAAATLPLEVLKKRFTARQDIDAIRPDDLPATAGVYQLRSTQRVLYIGETPNLRDWAGTVLERSPAAFAEVTRWSCVQLGTCAMSVRRGVQSRHVGRLRPEWNFPELAAEVA